MPRTPSNKSAHTSVHKPARSAKPGRRSVTFKDHFDQAGVGAESFLLLITKLRKIDPKVPRLKGQGDFGNKVMKVISRLNIHDIDITFKYIEGSGFGWVITGNPESVNMVKSCLSDCLDVWVGRLNNDWGFGKANKDLYTNLEKMVGGMIPADKQGKVMVKPAIKKAKSCVESTNAFGVLAEDNDLVETIDKQISAVLDASKTTESKPVSLSKKQLKNRKRMEVAMKQNAWCDGGRAWGQSN